MKRFLLCAVAGGLLGVPAAQAQFIEVENGGMEAWHDYSVSIPMSAPLALTAPNSWSGSDSVVAGLTVPAALAGIQLEATQQLFESTESHSGQFAAELQTKFVGDSIGNVPGVLANASIELDLAALAAEGDVSDPAQLLQYLTYTGGEAVTQFVDTVSAWVKVGAANQENALVVALALKTIPNSANNGDSVAIVGGGTYEIPASMTAYTEVFVPLTYSDSTLVPEQLITIFMSSSMNAPQFSENNTLFVDDVVYSLKNSVGMTDVTAENDLMLVYPVPAESVVHLAFSTSTTLKSCRLLVVDMLGREVTNRSITAAQSQIDVADWAPGTYYYLVSTEGRSQRGTIVVK